MNRITGLSFNILILLLCSSCVVSASPPSPSPTFPASSTPIQEDISPAPSISQYNNINSTISPEGYEYISSEENISKESIAYYFVSTILENLKAEDTNVSFQIKDYRNIEPGDIVWDDDFQAWCFTPQAEISFVGYYGLVGESDGSEYFRLHSGDDSIRDLDTDGDIGYLGFREIKPGFYKLFLFMP